MKNYLVITVGTRDVQLKKDLLETLPGWNLEPRKKGTFEVMAISKGEIEIEANYNKDFPDYYTCSPRLAGQLIANNTELFTEVLDFPLIKPVLDNLWAKSIDITNVLLIYTDQQTGYEKKVVKSNNYNNDTLYFKEIIQNILSKHPLLFKADFDDYVIWEQVANIDYQYDHFAEAHKELLLGDPEQVKQIFLLPQGGIDQINQAITLQLIQAFKHKVKLLQKAEGTAVQELNFTSRFLNDLNKQKIIKHLEDYDFGMITEDLHSNSLLYEKASYAYKRLSLNFRGIDDEEKCKDLYLAAKISLFKQKNPVECLWRLYTLNENLFKIEIEKILGDTRTYYVNGIGKYEVNPHWEEALNKVDVGIIPYLKKKRIDTNNPNRWAFKSIYIFFANNGIVSSRLVNVRKCIGDKIELLARKRNEIQHNLGFVSVEDLEKELSQSNYSIEKLFKDLDQLFELQTPYGIYDQIKDEIEDLLEKPYA